MIIEVMQKNAHGFSAPRFNFGHVHYSNIPRGFGFGFGDVFEIHQLNEHDSKLIITRDLTYMPIMIYGEPDRWPYEVALYINEEATISINFFGARLTARVFIEEDNVRILSQRFTQRGAFVRPVTLFMNVENGN